MKIYRLLSVLFLSILWVFVDSCQPQPEPSAQPGKTEAGARNSTDPTVGPYTLTFVGVTYANGQSTFTYQVQRTGPAQGNGLSHLIFGIGCATRVAGGTIDGGAANLAYSEGKGTGCQVSGNFVKFDNVADGVSDGSVHTFTITLAGLVAVASDGVWVKAGNACYSSTISGPGCGPPTTYDLGGRMEIRYCMGTMNDGTHQGQTGAYGVHVAGIPVQLVRADNTIAATTTTNGQGYYTFTNVPAGTYTVRVDTQTYNSTATNCTGQDVMDIVHVDAMVGQLTIPSAMYDMDKNMVDFWLDTFQPGTCSFDIKDGSDWHRGEDPYKYCPQQ